MRTEDVGETVLRSTSERRLLLRLELGVLDLWLLARRSLSLPEAARALCGEARALAGAFASSSSLPLACTAEEAGGRSMEASLRTGSRFDSFLSFLCDLRRFLRSS